MELNEEFLTRTAVQQALLETNQMEHVAFAPKLLSDGAPQSPYTYVRRSRVDDY